MEFIWYGQSCFKIKTEEKRIVIDPFGEGLGLKVPQLEADILLISHDHFDHNNKEAVKGKFFLINQPGEYEIKEIFVTAIESFHDQSEGKERGKNLIFKIEAEELQVCHLGDFGQKELTKEQLEKIGEVDVLMIPVGGIYTISGKEATKIMSQLEPKIIIPMHYTLPKLKVKLEPVEKFLKACGISSLTPQNKLKIKKKDLSPEEAKIILLKNQ